jgi:hypothetical protein
MSAFIVSRPHIHQLVTALNTYVAPTEDPTALGQRLWDENIASVAYRYHNDPISELPGTIGEDYGYSYDTPQRTLTPVEVHTMARGYCYQSCEHPAWDASEACQHVQALLTAIETRLGKTTAQIRDSAEGQAASWHILDDTQPAPPPVQDTRPVRRIDLNENAKIVRHALKTAYPTVKFSVRSSRYSMGCSIDVSWTDGPTQAMVQPLLNQFDGTSFDGTDDSTHYHTQQYQGETVSFAAHSVQANRRISTAFMQAIAEKVARQHGLTTPLVKNSSRDSDHGYVPSTPESRVRVPDNRYGSGVGTLQDLIHHVAYSTSALPKPRIRLYPVVLPEETTETQINL